MDTDRPDLLLPRQRSLILGLLLALAAAAWAGFIWHSHTTTEMTMTHAVGHTRHFIADWVVMMVAMMLLTTLPMILTFHKVQAANRRPRDAFGSTWVFVAAYLAVWAFAGLAAYVGMQAVEAAIMRFALPPATIAQIGGAIIVVAGIYQLTPLKDVCLSKCREPLDFIVTAWRSGATSALEMGLLYGAYCLGCCWLLFVILFPLGIMNVAAMAAVTLVILAEKTMPWPRLAPRYGWRTCALWCAGGYVTSTPSDLPARWWSGDARRHGSAPGSDRLIKRY